MFYAYDHTFAGLLTVLAHLFSIGEEPEGIGGGEPEQEDLFRRPVEIATDERRARALLAKVEARLGREAARLAYHAFLSGQPGVELQIYRYLALGRRFGRELDSHLAHPDVLPIHRWSRRVRQEAHRMQGLVRFRELEDGLFYAPIEPQFRILSLIAPHFAARFTDRRWLIHDLGRGEGLFFDGRDWLVGGVELQHPPRDSAEERLYSALWRRFFTAVAIPERRNPRLQRRLMPQRYWKHLTELGPEEAGSGATKPVHEP